MKKVKMIGTMCIFSILMLLSGVSVNAATRSTVALRYTVFTAKTNKKANNQVQWSDTEILEEGMAGKRGTMKFDVDGTLLIDFSGREGDLDLFINLYKNKVDPKNVVMSRMLTGEQKEQRVIVRIEAGNTYELVLSNVVYDGINENHRVDISMGFVSGEKKKSMKEKEACYTAAFLDGTTDYKIKPSKTGYITVSGKYLNGYLILCDAKKKELSKKDNGYISSESRYSYMRTRCFGVEKGKTYYLRVMHNSRGSGYYKITYTNTKKSDDGGASKKNAKLIKQKKIYAGNMIAGSSEADWYKLVNKSAKNVRLKVTGKATGYMKLVVYKDGKTTNMTVSDYTLAKGGRIVSIKTKNMSPKGTYYIKVVGGDKKSSGYYNMKWVK